MVYEAPITVRATCTGSSSSLAGIGRLVAAAQVWQVMSLYLESRSAFTVSIASITASSGLQRVVMVMLQAREAPVQRLADSVAGRFCYTVMAASAATFAFWTTAGARMLQDGGQAGEGQCLQKPISFQSMLHGCCQQLSLCLVSSRIHSKNI